MNEKLAPNNAPRSRGVFITLEGGEGAGKSTQIGHLSQNLRKAGIAVVATREPGGSAGAEILRNVLLSGVVKPLGPVAEAILFAAARTDHIDKTIEPRFGGWKMGHLGPFRRFDARLSRRPWANRSALFACA